MVAEREEGAVRGDGMTRCDSSSHARDVGGEEVNAVAVEVAAGAVVVLGGVGGSVRLRADCLLPGLPVTVHRGGGNFRICHMRESQLGVPGALGSPGTW
jgi:hypothetical protein